jgi:hypothetical protein
LAQKQRRRKTFLTRIETRIVSAVKCARAVLLFGSNSSRAFTQHKQGMVNVRLLLPLLNLAHAAS